MIAATVSGPSMRITRSNSSAQPSVHAARPLHIAHR
jgi:hypothetical protein